MTELPALWSNEAERAVLGSILIDPPALHEVADQLRPQHFNSPLTRAAYRALLSLDRGNVAIDPVTLTETLERMDVREPENGWTFWTIELVNAVPTSVNVASYGRIVADYGQRREMVRVANEVLQLAHDKEISAEAALGQAQAAVLEVQKENDTGRVLQPRQYVRTFLDDLDRDDDYEFIPTPFVGLNQLLLGGLRKPFAHFIAGRPKMGKSALAMQIVGHVALNLKKRAYLATTEMSDLQFTRRVISQQTGIPMSRLMKRSLSNEERETVYEASGRLEQYGPALDVSAGLTPSQVRARAMREAGTRGLDLIVVDHIHEMQPDKSKSSRHLELGDMARHLRDTAKAEALDIPIIIVAQLNRGVERARVKEPDLAHFREAGALEETAYTVTFVHRPAYYDETADEEEAHLILRAHRDGPTGSVGVKWNGPLMRFENPTVSSNNGTGASATPGRYKQPEDAPIRF